MNESNEVQTNSGTETHVEGNPEVEKAEQKVFGTHYTQMEVLHIYADEHPWVHPALLAVNVLIITGIVWFVVRRRKIMVDEKNTL